MTESTTTHLPPHTHCLASPPAASGATWLINCLLELGVMTDCDLGGPAMWEPTATLGEFRLADKADFLKRHLPSLSQHDTFTFRPNLRVQWGHHLPPAENANNHPDWQCILMTRDPRDALFSQHKRIGSGLSFPAYLQTLSFNTLLPIATDWALYHRLWLDHPAMRCVVLFENYRADAKTTLAQALQAMGIEASDDAIAQACTASDFKQAQAAEQAFKKQTNDHAPTMNRAGIAHEWQTRGKQDPALAETFANIEQATWPVLQELGYATPNRATVDGRPSQNHQDGESFWHDLGVFMRCLPDTFRGCHFPVCLQTPPDALHGTLPGLVPDPGTDSNIQARPSACSNPHIQTVLDQAPTWSPATLHQAGLQPYQAKLLLQRHADFVQSLLLANTQPF